MESIKIGFEMKEMIAEYKYMVDQMLQQQTTDTILSFLQENMEVIKYDNELMTVWYLGMIEQKEIKAGVKSIFQKENSLEGLLLRYQTLKFFLRRIENNVLEDPMQFYSFLMQKNISEYELMGVIDGSVYKKENVWKFFNGK